MEKYIIRFACERDIDNFMWEVKTKTEHWAISPKIRRNDRPIEFGNAILYLVCDQKQEIGRHDYIRISAMSVLYTIMLLNERMRIGHQGIFDKG